MPKIPLIGVSDSGRTPDINSHRAVNLMPQIRNTGAKEQFYWIGAPGLKDFATIAGVSRGQWALDGYIYYVVGTSFYKIDSAGAITTISNGGVTSSTNTCVFANNESQVAFVQGTDEIYVYDFIDDVFTVVEEWSTEYPVTQIVNVSTTTYRATTSITHSAIIGDDVIFKGTTNFNRAYTITAVAATTFDFTHINSTDADETSLTDAAAFVREDDLPVTPTHITYMDSYGIVNNTTNDDDEGIRDVDFFVSYPSDFRIWEPADTGSAQRDPDAIKAIFAFQGDLWLFGEISTETYYNTGSGTQPFAPTRPSALQWGCLGPYTVAQTGDGIAFLGTKKYGHPTVLLTSGYNMQEVSNHALDYNLSLFTPAELAEATAFAYHEEGSEFYVITFGNDSLGKQTWVFDSQSTAGAGVFMWHERQDYNGDEFRGKYYGYLNGKHIVSDHTESKLLEMDRATYTDLVGSSTENITRIGVSGPIHSDDMAMFHHTLVVDMEHPVGTGVVYLSWSDDGGHTYSSEASRSFTGRDTRVQFDALGMARNQRVYKIRIDAALPVNINTAYVRIEQGLW